MVAGPAFLQLPALRVEGIVIFPHFQHLLSPEDDQRLVQRQPQHLVRRQELALPDGVRLPVLRCVIRYPPGVELLRLAGYGYADLAGAVGDELRRQLVGAAQEELGVAVADDLLPLVQRVAVLHLGQVLEDAADGELPGADGADLLCQVCDGAAAVGELVRQDMHRHREPPAFPVPVRVAHQLDEHEGHEQGGEEVEGGVLIRGDAEVRALLMARLRQADLVVAGDLPNQPVLEYLQPCPQPDDDTAAHRVGCLAEDVVGRLCRVGDREQVEEAVQLLFAAHGQQLVHLPDVLPLRREPLVHIQHECLQKVHLRIVPEPVTLW